MQALNLVPAAGKGEIVSSVGKHNCFIIQSSSCFWIPRRSDRKKEKSVVSFTHGQNIICSQAQLDDIEHEQTITCRQLFAGHVVGSRPMKRKNNLLRMIITFVPTKSFYFFAKINRLDTNIRIIQTPWHLPLVSILTVSTEQEFLN